MCQPETSYLASPDFMATTLHILASIELPFVSFGGYCILFKTPNQMQPVKLHLLNLHMWTAISDLVLCFLGIPYILLPTMAGWGLGAAYAPGLLFYLCVTLHAVLAASIIAIYENRFYCIYGWKTVWSRFRKPTMLGLYMLVPFMFLPPYFFEPDQSYARLVIRETLPCLSPYTYDNYPMYVLSLDYKIPFLCIAISGMTLFTFAMLFFLLTIWKTLSKTVSSSRKTQNLQSKFAFAIFLQSLFLFGVICVPVCLGLGTIVFWYHSQVLNNIIFIILSFHGIGSTIVMLLVHKPYREYAYSVLYISSKTENRRKLHISSTMI